MDNRLLGEEGVTRSLYLQAGIDYYRPLDFFLKRPFQEDANRRELDHAIDCFKPDLTVVWNMWNLSRNLPYWAERRMPGRVAYYMFSTWLADADAHFEYWKSPARHRVSGWLMRPARALALSQLHHEGYPPKLCLDHVMCVSRFLRDTCRAAGELPGKAGVLYNGIDPMPFANKPRTYNSSGNLHLLYFGALLPIKGVHTAIEAMHILKGRGYADLLDLTLIGSGHPDYERRLRALVAQFDLQSKICFVGRMPRDALAEIIPQYDVFLFTSCGPEAMARTVMEAMAAGLLVIGAETGGQVEMLANRENALTFRAGDEVGLADQIEAVLKDRDLLPLLAQAGQKTVFERFTLDRMTDNIETWLEGVVL